jgi:hypothetical protein
MGQRVQGTLQKISKQVIDDMINEITTAKVGMYTGRVATGGLKNSFRSHIDKNYLGIFSKTPLKAEVVDKGKPKGNFVPIAPLRRWATIKGIVPKNNRSIKQFAFAVSKKLMKSGYPGINYIAKSFLNAQTIIDKELSESYLLDLQEQLKKEIPNLK